jgi:hypothetical protein
VENSAIQGVEEGDGEKIGAGQKLLLREGIKGDGSASLMFEVNAP